MFIGSGSLLGNVLLSQDPSVQVPSALEGLTVVFGMGTCGTPPLSPPNDAAILRDYSLKTRSETKTCDLKPAIWISPRPISTGQLHALLHFHPQPIYLVVFKGSYILGNLILRGASRLDAFSAYPVRT